MKERKKIRCVQNEREREIRRRIPLTKNFSSTNNNPWDANQAFGIFAKINVVSNTSAIDTTEEGQFQSWSEKRKKKIWKKIKLLLKLKCNHSSYGEKSELSELWWWNDSSSAFVVLTIRSYHFPIDLFELDQRRNQLQ